MICSWKRYHAPVILRLASRRIQSEFGSEKSEKSGAARWPEYAIRFTLARLQKGQVTQEAELEAGQSAGHDQAAPAILRIQG